MNFFVIREYTGPKWTVCITGGGVSTALTGTFPGASKLIDLIVIPYSNEVLEEMFGTTSHPACSLERTLEIWNKIGADCGLLINAALTTSRYRKGLNHAFIQCPWAQIHIILPKLSEEDYQKLSLENIAEIRAHEDFIIGVAAVAVMMGKDVDEEFVREFINEAELTVGTGTTVDIIQFDRERKLELFPDSE